MSVLQKDTPRKPLTLWIAEDTHREQGRNVARHGNHSLSGEPRTGILSKVYMQFIKEVTHSLRAKDGSREQGTNAAHHGTAYQLDKRGHVS